MPRTRVEVDVTPQFAHGNAIICDVEPPSQHRKGGHLRLPKGSSYTLQFKLLPGAPADLHFKPEHDGACDAFWSDAHECPQHAMNARQYKNPRLVDADTLEVDVDVEHHEPPTAVHYRLNFDDGRSFDPIIIHE
jgi:hypothetical protein